MSTSIAFTPLPDQGVRAGATTLAASVGMVLRPADPTYVWAAEAVAVLDRHVDSSSIEVAGLLVGRVWVDNDGAGTLVAVDAALPATRHVETSSVHVSFRPETWDELSREIDRVVPNGLVVGWYHSHPGLTAFFSGTDRATQAGAFREPWQLGLVVDPRGGARAAFRGPESVPVEVSGFVVTPDRLPEPPSGPGRRRARDRAWSRRSQSWALLASLGVVVVALAWRTRRDRGRSRPRV